MTMSFWVCLCVCVYVCVFFFFFCVFVRACLFAKIKKNTPRHGRTGESDRLRLLRADPSGLVQEEHHGGNTLLDGPRNHRQVSVCLYIYLFVSVCVCLSWSVRVRVHIQPFHLFCFAYLFSHWFQIIYSE